MTRRRRHVLRAVAIVLVLQVGVSCSRALALLPPRCANCPADCPMHVKKKIGCHKGGAMPQDPHGDCHRQGRGAGLRSAGCTHHTENVLAADRALLPVMLRVRPAPRVTHHVGQRSAPPADVIDDPPFHPPR